MQKNLKNFFVQYLQKQFHPLNPGLLGKLQQHPPGTPSPKDCFCKYCTKKFFRFFCI